MSSQHISLPFEAFPYVWLSDGLVGLRCYLPNLPDYGLGYFATFPIYPNQSIDWDRIQWDDVQVPVPPEVQHYVKALIRNKAFL